MLENRYRGIGSFSYAQASIRKCADLAGQFSDAGPVSGKNQQYKLRLQTYNDDLEREVKNRPPGWRIFSRQLIDADTEYRMKED